MTLAVFVLLGMPGVGKGTQAQLVADNYKLHHIDTGSTLRGEIASGSELGLTAKGYMDKGELVPFDLVLAVIKSSMSKIASDKKGYLFDGFPRNISQAEGLEKILGELKLKINSVLYLETPKDILMDRLAYRVTCPDCDIKYNLKLNPPQNDGACDDCGTSLVTRPDDRPEVIENRLNAYEKETSPLIGYYDEKKLLRRINADQAIDTVTKEIEAVIDPVLASSKH